MELYFTWNGRDSRELGLVLAKRPAYMVPAERVSTVEIPGRSGFVTLSDGAGTYAGYQLSLEVGNRRTSSPAAITNWLRGPGELVLSCEPDRVYYGRLIRDGNLAHLFKGIYSGTLAFNVQPLKGQFPPEPPIETALFYNLYNPGDVAARPRYTVYGSGLLLLSVGYRPGIQEDWGSQITVDLSETNYTGAVVDTESMMVTDPDGVENLNHLSTVYFHGPKGLWVPPGECYISWNVETVTSIKIEPRWRWI